MPGFGSKVVESPQRKMQMISLKKEGLGAPTLAGSCASFCSVTDNGVGDYTINLDSVPLAQLPEVMVTPSTPSTAVSIGTVTALAIQVLVTDLAGAPAEGDFHMVIAGCLARDLVGV